MLDSSQPKDFFFCEKRPVPIFTDGSWETGKSGIGALILDPASGSDYVLSGEVPDVLIASWKIGDQLICQM